MSVIMIQNKIVKILKHLNGSHTLEFTYIQQNTYRMSPTDRVLVFFEVFSKSHGVHWFYDIHTLKYTKDL